MSGVAQAELNILLVEDDDIDARAFQRVLGQMEVAGNLYHAGDGVEGLEMLRSGELPDPVLIVTDLNMPRMDGMAMIDAIRADEQLCSMSIFVLSTSCNLGDKKQAYRLNVAGYVNKSNLPESLGKFVEMLRDYANVVDLP